MASNIGVVGLGRMGAAFAANLLADGYRVFVNDRDAERVRALQAHGATASPQPRDLAECDIVLTSLPNDEALADVALGDEGIVAVLQPGSVHVSTSTVSPAVSRRVAQAHVAHGQGYVAAPVLGNPDFARDRTLFILTGGKAAAVEKVRPVLERLGQRLFAIGEDAGSANLMKLAANVLTATTLECMGEVLALLRKGASTATSLSTP